MRLTPLDIRKQEFARRVRGVDADEVSAFLQTVSTQWDELVSEHRQLELKVREMEAKLQHYVHVEEALQEALRTARESAKQTLETAKQQADGIVGAARQQADEIRRAAELERADLRREATEVQSQRDEIVARLRAFLNSEMEILLRFDADRVGTDSPAPPPSFGKPQGDVSGTAQRTPDSVGIPAPAFQPVNLPAPELSPERSASPAFGEDAGGTGARPPVQAPALPDREDSRFAGGWVVKPVIGSGARPAPPEDPPELPPVDETEQFGIAASDDELERIRQILKDLD